MIEEPPEELPDECCAKCRFYKDSSHEAGRQFDDPSGFCQRYPPAHHHGVQEKQKPVEFWENADASHYWAWYLPVVMFDHWCGEFQPHHKGDNS